MIELIKRYLYNNKKRDAYQAKIIAIKDGQECFNFYVKLTIGAKKYPTRRDIAKAYGYKISSNIKKYSNFKGCRIEVIIISKIGTFKRKQLVEF